MLSDRVKAVLPERSAFLKPYVEYASHCSDAPDVYHVGVALTIFAGAIAKKLICPYMAGRMLVPNLYTLLVGPSRSARKTGSMDMGIDILQKADYDTVIPVPGSYEELIAQVRSTPSGLLTNREFGHFLKTTARGYGEPIRTVLMELFDWAPDRPYVRNLRKGKTIIEAPICLSMLSAVSTDILFEFCDTVDWTGGFFGRMCLLYGEREGFRMPVPWDAARNWLVAQMHAWVHAGIPQCGGFSPDAWNAFSIWSQYRDSHAVDAPDRVQSFVSGAPTLAAKIALLYAADSHEPLAGNGWLISYESIQRAVMFVDMLYLPSVYLLGEKLRTGIWEKDRGRVLDIIESKRGPIARSELLRRARCSSEMLDTITLTLREELTIVVGSNTKGEVTYKRAPGGTVLPFPSGGHSSDIANSQG